MGTLVPGSMFSHLMTPIKGPTKMNRLDKSAETAASQTIHEGSLCSLNSSKKLIVGCAAGSVANRPMPMFAIQDVNDFDANSDGVIGTGATVSMGGNISGGVQSALVATGGFEISTSEYSTVGTPTYNPNDLLTDGTAGLVKKATAAPYGAENIVGCVSDGVATNVDGVSVLAFWTMFLPAGS